MTCCRAQIRSCCLVKHCHAIHAAEFCDGFQDCPFRPFFLPVLYVVCDVRQYLQDEVCLAGLAQPATARGTDIASCFRQPLAHGVTGKMIPRCTECVHLQAAECQPMRRTPACFSTLHCAVYYTAAHNQAARLTNQQQDATCSSSRGSVAAQKGCALGHGILQVVVPEDWVTDRHSPGPLAAVERWLCKCRKYSRCGCSRSTPTAHAEHHRQKMLTYHLLADQGAVVHRGQGAGAQEAMLFGWQC